MEFVSCLSSLELCRIEVRSGLTDGSLTLINTYCSKSLADFSND